MIYENMSDPIQEYCISNGLKKSSTQSITYMLKHYERFQETTLSELIEEAEEEEDKGIRWKHRKLKRRLISYTNHLQQTMMYSSAVVYLSTVKSFYRYFEIEIHNMPGLNKKNSNLPVPISFKDLPDKEVIRQSLEITTPLLQAAILFMASSGCSRKETLNLTIQDYLDSVQEYIKGMDFQAALRFLVENDNVVPTFRLRRQKTNKYYYTFCTPEASQKIAYYLIIRCHNGYDVTERLFDIGLHHFSTKFAKINDHHFLARIGFQGFLQNHQRAFQVFFFQHVGYAHLVFSGTRRSVEAGSRRHHDGFTLVVEILKTPAAELLSIVDGQARHRVEGTHRYG